MRPIDLIARRPLFYAALVFAGLIFSARLALPGFYYLVPPEDISQKLREPKEAMAVRGVIVSDPETRHNAYGQDYVSFILRCHDYAPPGAEFRRVRGKLRASVKTPRLKFEEGDTVELEGEISKPRGRRNPGGFDYREYLDRRGVHALIYCNKDSEYRVLEKNASRGLVPAARRVRHFLSSKLDRGFPKEEAAFLKALLLGERADVTVEFEELFIRTGTLHILAVSGFNVGFLTAVVLCLLAPFPLPKNVRLVAALALIWAYCFVIGWQAPLVRASIMATVYIAGRLAGRRSDLLNSLGLAALIILGANPKSLFDVGFQLSFLAVAGLAAFTPALLPERVFLPGEGRSLRQKLSLYAEELFWVSFVATFVTLPITVQNFFVVTPASLAANMIVVPLSFGLFFCGALYFLTFWWVPKAALFVPLAMKYMMELFTRSLTWMADWPLACITVGNLHPVLWTVLTAGIFYFFTDKRIKSASVRAAALFLFALNVFLFQDVSRHFERRFAMTVLDVGQGDAIYLEFPGGGSLLVDAGRGEGFDQARRNVVPFLKYKGVRELDAFVISHPQSDHIGGLSAVLKDTRVRNVIGPGKPYGSELTTG